MRIRNQVAAILAGTITATLAPTAAIAAPSASLSVKQTGTSVTVNWSYKGGVPTYQKLVVTRVAETVAPLEATAPAESTTPETTPVTSTVDPLAALLAEPVVYTLKKTARTQKISDLEPGAKYTFVLTSKKPTLKVTRTVTVLEKPARPENVRLSWIGEELLVLWDYDGPAVKSWELSSAGSDNKAAVKTSTGSSTTTTRLKGLDKALGYTVTVRGTNAAGTGVSGNETILQVAPNRPKNLQVRPLNLEGTKVAVTWEYDGPAVLAYKVQIKSPGFTRDLDTLSAASNARQVEIDGLSVNGTYTFVVTARNSASTAVSNTDPYLVTKVLSPPTALLAAPGNSSMVLRWTAPVTDATNPITGYRIDYSADNGSTWRSFLAQGTATSYTVTGLLNGESYSFRVAGLTAKGSGIVGEAITAIAGQVPAAPGNVKLTGGARQITVTWTAPAVSSGAILGYKIEYKKSTETTWKQSPDTSALTTTITGLEGGIAYNARVAAVGESGQGLFSAPGTANAFDVPGAPVATVTPGNRKADLKWSTPVSNGAIVTGYKVEQQTGDGVWTTLTATAITLTNYSVINLVPGTTYRFRVYAINSAGSGPESAPVIVSLVATPDSPVVTATPSAGQASLSWTEPVANGGTITAYKVERSTNGGTWSTLSETVTGTTYTVTGLTNGTSYAFRVSARNSAGWSTPSAGATATPITVPIAVSNVVVEPNIEEIKVRWSAIPATATSTGGSAVTGYVVVYRAAAGTWQTAPGGLVAGSVLQLEVSDLVPGTTYEFKVYAINSAGNGPESAVRTGVPYSAPLAPTNVAAVGKDGEVALSWSSPGQAISAVVGAAFKYKVDYSIDGATWLPAKENQSEITATISGLRNGTPYRFRISAGYTVGGKTSYGEVAEISATPRGVPGAPEGLRLQQLNGTTIRVTWSAPANSGGGLLGDYELSYTTNGTTWIPEPVLTTTGTTLDVTIPTAGLPYTFRIRSTNTFGQSPFATAELTPLRAPGTVTGLSVRQLASGEVTLGWNANIAAEAVTGYRIEYSTGNNIWTLFDGSVTNTLSTVTGLTNGTAYSFRVSARNIAGFSTGAVTTGTPAGPLPVNAIAANAADSKVTLNWSLPAASGVTITGVRVRYTSDNGVTVTTLPTLSATATSTIVDTLTNGTAYTFEVAVLTNLGESAGVRVSATPWAQLPSIVGNLTATPATTTVALDWDAPSTTGVGTIGYRVEYKLSSASTWSTAAANELTTAFNVTSLVAATSYDFRITAVNAAGDSPVATTTATTGA